MKSFETEDNLNVARKHNKIWVIAKLVFGFSITILFSYLTYVNQKELNKINETQSETLKTLTIISLFQASQLEALRNLTNKQLDQISIQTSQLVKTNELSIAQSESLIKLNDLSIIQTTQLNTNNINTDNLRQFENYKEFSTSTHTSGWSMVDKTQCKVGFSYVSAITNLVVNELISLSYPKTSSSLVIASGLCKACNGNSANFEIRATLSGALHCSQLIMTHPCCRADTYIYAPQYWLNVTNYPEQCRIYSDGQFATAGFSGMSTFSNLKCMVMI